MYHQHVGKVKESELKDDCCSSNFEIPLAIKRDLCFLGFQTHKTQQYRNIQFAVVRKRKPPFSMEELRCVNCERLSLRYEKDFRYLELWIKRSG